jgi:hypothetical protein
LIVDATEQNQREKHEQILNDLGREEWEAVAYIAQSDTVLLKKPAKDSTIEKRPGNAGDHPRRVIAYFAITAVVGREEASQIKQQTLFFLMLLPPEAYVAVHRVIHRFS